jgi:hypothetical protein
MMEMRPFVTTNTQTHHGYTWLASICRIMETLIALGEMPKQYITIYLEVLCFKKFSNANHFQKNILIYFVLQLQDPWKPGRFSAMDIILPHHRRIFDSLTGF